MEVLYILGIIGFCIWWAVKSQEEADFKRRQDEISEKFWETYNECKAENEKKYGKKD